MRRADRKQNPFLKAASPGLVLGCIAALGACRGSPAGAAAPRPEQAVADAIYLVLSADRETYTSEVVNRLQNQEKVIKASEHWRNDKALPLPAQMFRMGAERVRKRTDTISYALRSAWPINKQNSARTPVEIAGLQILRASAGHTHYAEETLGGKRYLTAVYADKAVSPACVDCHNHHPESPRKDFHLGDVMGAVVIRVALP